jgi:nucleoside phosphorylase/GTP-binding protein EngB required for normal cell division
MSRSSLKRQLRHEEYSVALICPRELVLSATRFMLDEEHEGLPRAKRDPLNYVLGSMSGHNVVIATLPGQVQEDVATASIATHLVHTFPAAELRLLVSIGGGIPSASNDIRLGDVVVSDPDPTRGGVTTHDFGKETTDGFQRRARYLSATPAPLIGACMGMKHDNRASPNQISNIIHEVYHKRPELTTFCRPPSETDALLHSSHDNPHATDNAQRAVFRLCRSCPNQSNIFYGMISAGARLVTDINRRDKLAREFGAICLDTAASGMECFPGLVVCGIYHYCDSEYRDSWSGYAAAAAAACVRHMLSFISLTGMCTRPSLRTTTFDKVTADPKHCYSTKSQLKTRREALLKKLHLRAYQDEKSSHARPIDGTCQWLTVHSSFEQWVDGNTPGLLWVSSDPWTGKSVLARHLVDKVLPSSPGRTVCYYFFTVDYEDSRLSRAMCCILHQLFEQRSELNSESVLTTLESKDVPRSILFSDLFEMLIDVVGHQDGEVILVLDAIDKIASYEREELVNELVRRFDAAAIPSLKILFTSRPCSTTQRSIQALENKNPSIYICGDGRIPAYQIAKDIGTYI